MKTHPVRPFAPRLAPIAEHPPLTPTPRYLAGDRVMLATRDGYLRTGVVVGRAGQGGAAPTLWVRLSSGRAVPLDCPDITILRRL